jgi:hypothetical protein
MRPFPCLYQIPIISASVTGPRQGWTPLHYAARNGRSEVVGALLDKGGAAVDATDVSGRGGTWHMPLNCSMKFDIF